MPLTIKETILIPFHFHRTRRLELTHRRVRRLLHIIAPYRSDILKCQPDFFEIGNLSEKSVK